MVKNLPKDNPIKLMLDEQEQNKDKKPIPKPVKKDSGSQEREKPSKKEK